MRQWLANFLTRKSLSSPSEQLLQLFGGYGPTHSGISVTAETALRVPAVACAVRVIAEAVGQIPLIVYERGADGSKQRAVDHPAYSILHDDVSDWQSSADFRQQLTVDALLKGNGFGLAIKVRGKIREIVRLSPTAVTVKEDDGRPVYLLNEGEGQRILPPDQVLHIKGISTDGITGKSAVLLAAEAIGLAAALEQHAARLMGHGGRPSGLLTVGGRVNPDALERLRASWSDLHSGRNAGGTAIFEEGTKFEPIAFTSVDMQFLELRKYQIDEIARAFRVPPHLLMELGRATWSNSEEMGRVFLVYTLLPWLEQWEAAIRRAVFSKDDRKTYFAEFLLDDFQRADTAKRADAYGKLIASRIMSPNEIRAAENLPPYPGGEKFENPNVSPSPAGSAADQQDPPA